MNRISPAEFHAALRRVFASSPVAGSACAVFKKELTDGGYAVFPGFVDVHVHLREPGFSYKETMESGTRAAAHGGYTAVCSMPNLDPVPDSPANLQVQLDAIARSAVVTVLPYGAITAGQGGARLADLSALSPHVAGFSDDGRGVQSEEMMRRAMLQAKALGKPIVAHCEDNALLRGGYIHDGAYARIHGHAGICGESEWRPIRRDLELVRQTGCAYHVCHVSAKESVALLRQAKAEGLDVTCETAPHYLLLNDSMLREEGRYKMNPPIRDELDRQALLEGLRDGTIDMIATDHAPHSAEEKNRGLRDSLMGVVGLETAFPLLYTYLVKPGRISMERLLETMCFAPRRRFSLPLREEDFCVWDLTAEERIDPNRFLSKGRATPFAGYPVSGKCLLSVCGGRIAYAAEENTEETKHG